MFLRGTESLEHGPLAEEIPSPNFQIPKNIQKPKIELLGFGIWDFIWRLIVGSLRFPILVG
jgi:hypothetical protein